MKKISSSTPESEFDDWFTNTHPKGTASWEQEDDVDEVDFDPMDDPDE